jgi:hypothetical protein
MEMTLVKSLHSGDPHMIKNTQTSEYPIIRGKVASAIQEKAIKSLIPNTFELALLVLVHVKWPHALGQSVEWLFPIMLASHREGLGSFPGRDMSVLGPTVV